MSAQTVRVVRHRDPLEGQCLQVLRRVRRRGGLELLLLLPDGSKRRVPAAWTDLAGQVDVRPVDGQVVVGGDGDVGVATPTLGLVADLLAACGLVTALMTAATGCGQEQAARTSSCEEDDRAACPVESDPPGGTGATCAGAGPAPRSGCGGSSRPAGPSDRRDARSGPGRRGGRR